jgi:hypothetical protein
MITNFSSAARLIMLRTSVSERDAPVGLPGLMMTIARTSVPASRAVLREERMVETSVPQLEDSSRL